VVKFADQVFDSDELCGRHHVGFVEHDNVGEFDLVDHEVGDGSFVFRCDIVSPRGQQIDRLKIVKHGESVNDRARSVQPRELVQSTGIFQPGESSEGGRIESLGTFAHGADLFSETSIESLGDLFGFGDARGLDDDVVELGEFGQADEFFEEVAAEGAADAAVGEGLWLTSSALFKALLRKHVDLRSPSLRSWLGGVFHGSGWRRR
jgi:hypothetical protein